MPTIGLVVSKDGKVRLTVKRKAETNEWKVNWFDLIGCARWVYNEDKTCYTDDKKDAEETMIVSMNRYDEQHQNTKVEYWVEKVKKAENKIASWRERQEATLNPVEKDGLAILIGEVTDWVTDAKQFIKTIGG
ncbi:MAG: hypothetical protein KAS32_10205 [Candidatus Peribacteraceae bacterium]|nr:hypothetical protein [Candidatus Peribacteraceae bacterium]